MSKKPSSSVQGKSRDSLLSVPLMAWLVVFFFVPTLLIFAMAFKVPDVSGGIAEAWTLDTLSGIFKSDYLLVIWRTFWVSLTVTAICMVLSVPVGYWVAQQNPKYRYWYLILIIVPLWTNFLIRIFAWRMVLHPEGFLRSLLLKLGIISDDVFLLNNLFAVIIVTVYTCLPFAILPIYAAAEKFDYSLMAAARDLGASRFLAFWKIFIPGIRRGIFSALLLTLIPALGSYAIPDLVGGVESGLIGNKIAAKISFARNLPEASALSALLWVIIATLALALILWQRKAHKINGQNGQNANDHPPAPTAP